MTNKQAYAGLLERLEEEALSKAGSSIDRGCVDCGLSATLCNEAAEAISSLLKALESVPIPGMKEPMPVFYERMNDWLNTTYRAALSGEKL